MTAVLVPDALSAQGSPARQPNRSSVRFHSATAPAGQAASEAAEGRPHRDFWYAPSAALRTSQARDEARRIADSITRGESVEDPGDQSAIFRALHTSAYWAADGHRSRHASAPTRQRWARRWMSIREHLIENNLGLVHSTLARYRAPDVDDDDLLSDALVALQRAVERYNPFRGFRFSTYACNCISRACMRCCRRNQKRRQRFPVQYEPNMEQPAVGQDDELALRLERLERAVNQNEGQLTDLEAGILTRRFPLAGGERLTFREIGDAIGLSKERVRQIQNIALDKLRHALESDPLVT